MGGNEKPPEEKPQNPPVAGPEQYTSTVTQDDTSSLSKSSYTTQQSQHSDNTLKEQNLGLQTEIVNSELSAGVTLSQIQYAMPKGTLSQATNLSS